MKRVRSVADLHQVVALGEREGTYEGEMEHCCHSGYLLSAPVLIPTRLLGKEKIWIMPEKDMSGLPMTRRYVLTDSMRHFATLHSKQNGAGNL